VTLLASVQVLPLGLHFSVPFTHNVYIHRDDPGLLTSILTCSSIPHHSEDTPKNTLMVSYEDIIFGLNVAVDNGLS
jgi:hypothetical protein